MHQIYIYIYAFFWGGFPYYILFTDKTGHLQHYEYQPKSVGGWSEETQLMQCWVNIYQGFKT